METRNLYQHFVSFSVDNKEHLETYSNFYRNRQQQIKICYLFLGWITYLNVAQDTLQYSPPISHDVCPLQVLRIISKQFQSLCTCYIQCMLCFILLDSILLNYLPKYPNYKDTCSASFSTLSKLHFLLSNLSSHGTKIRSARSRLCEGKFTFT
jgi:hypothetical protein